MHMLHSQTQLAVQTKSGAESIDECVVYPCKAIVNCWCDKIIGLSPSNFHLSQENNLARYNVHRHHMYNVSGSASEEDGRC